MSYIYITNIYHAIKGESERGGGGDDNQQNPPSSQWNHYWGQETKTSQKLTKSKTQNLPNATTTTKSKRKSVRFQKKLLFLDRLVFLDFNPVSMFKTRIISLLGWKCIKWRDSRAEQK